MTQYIVKMENISKSFPGVKALNQVSFNLKAGEVMALLGENGAGKSTLMKVLSGIYQQEEGTITLFDEEMGILNPKLAKEKEIAIIHQELNMCRHLTVAENIFLGRERDRHRFLLNNGQMNSEAQKICDKHAGSGLFFLFGWCFHQIQ